MYMCNLYFFPRIEFRHVLKTNEELNLIYLLAKLTFCLFYKLWNPVYPIPDTTCHGIFIFEIFLTNLLAYFLMMLSYLLSTNLQNLIFEPSLKFNSFSNSTKRCLEIIYNYAVIAICRVHWIEKLCKQIKKQKKPLRTLTDY